MKKYESVFITMVIMAIIFGWIGYRSSQNYLKTIGNLRSSIIEARSLLDSPNKEQIEYAKTILQNAQSSLEKDRED